MRVKRRDGLGSMVCSSLWVQIGKECKAPEITDNVENTSTSPRRYTRICTHNYVHVRLFTTFKGNRRTHADVKSQDDERGC